MAWSVGAASVEERPEISADSAPAGIGGMKLGGPEISVIDSSTPTCFLADPRTGTCSVEWSYLYVTADSGPYIISMSVEIDGRIRANSNGFFQTYMYLPSDIFGSGFEMPCGLAGAGGVPGLGELYSFVVRAKQSDGLTSSSSGAFYCPFATLPLFSDGFESGDASAWSAKTP
jgi:hypothetical protein